MRFGQEEIARRRGRAHAVVKLVESAGQFAVDNRSQGANSRARHFIELHEIQALANANRCLSFLGHGAVPSANGRKFARADGVARKLKIVGLYAATIVSGWPGLRFAFPSRRVTSRLVDLCRANPEQCHAPRLNSSCFSGWR